MRVKRIGYFILSAGIFVCLCSPVIAAPPTWTISGVVATADGIGVEGVDVVGDNGATSAVTAADGSYSIVVPNHWDGTITVSKPGWLITPESNTYTNAVEDKLNENYTAYQPKISGYVRKSDSTPLAGATVTANNGGGSDTTDAAGYYEIAVPYNWSGTVSATLAGYHFTDKNYINIITDQTNQDFSGYQPKISGYVRNADGTGLGGVAVTASNSGGSTSSATDGYYEIIIPYNWSGVVSATLAGYHFTDKSYANVVTDRTNQNFSGFQPKISGYVRNATGTGLSGATVTSNNGGGSTSTNSSGYYQITVPYNWSGALSAIRTGYGFTDKNYTDVIVNQTNQNFTGYQPKISGYVRKTDGSGLVGVTVTANNGGGTSTTNTSGYYEIVVPYNWSGQVNANKLKWDITPQSYSYVNVINDQIGQDFSAVDISTIIVKADGTGYVPTIQAAIDIASDGVIVQLENGTYTGDGNRDVDFQGKAITVRGNMNDPNLVVIDCQGTETEPHRGFVFINNESLGSILMGITITNGFGPIPSTMLYSVGGAVYCRYSSPTIRDCIIISNVAYVGGGFYGYYSNPTVQNCIINNNSAIYNGGGLYGCHGTINGCSIKNNSAGDGAGLYDCDGIINSCNIIENSAIGSGGGLAGCDGAISDCIISNNSGATGGGLRFCNGTVKNCVINGNSAIAAGGGGLYFCDATVENCIIKNNSTVENGGGLDYCDGTILNCIISNNSAGNYGGGLHYCNAEIINCTVVENSAQVQGGGLDFCYSAIIENCIIWGNTALYNVQRGTNTSIPNYSCLQGWWYNDEYSNIGDDPLFIDSENGDYHLSFDSPCINRASGYGAGVTDIDGDPRSVGFRDMGADEVFVNGSAAMCIISGRYFEFIAEGINSETTVQALDIFNCGTEILNWSIDNDCNWLNISSASGQISGGMARRIFVFIDTQYADYGFQSCQFQINSANSVNSPQYVTVNLEVLRPEIGLSQNSVNFISESITDSPVSQMLTISNMGYDTLDWTIAGADACGWLLVSPESGQAGGGTPNEVTLSVDPAIAGYGSHSCELTVSDPNASNSPQVVTVTLDVLGPGIGVSTGTTSGMVYFEGDVDEPNVLSQVVAISNSGYDTLNWQISEDCPWLSVSPANGQCVSGPNDVTLMVDAAGLEIGFYSCQLTIADDNASNSPVTVPVSLHVYRDGERHVPIEYPTIQHAIDAAVDGDHVIVHPGRYPNSPDSYYERIDFNGKAVTVRSIDPTNPEIVASTILDRGYVYFDQEEGRNSVLDGLTINGSITCYNSSPVIKNCIFGEPMPTTTSSGSISIYQGNPHILNCTFAGMTGMRDQNGRSIYIGDNRYTAGDTIIENCLLSVKSSEPYMVSGIQLHQAHANIVNTTIAYCLTNTDDPYSYLTNGAGLLIRQSDVLLKNSIVWGNRGIDDTQIVIINNSGDFDDPLNSHIDVSYSSIEGGQDKMLLFPHMDAFQAYQYDSTLPDPNLIDPATLTWGPGNMDIDPLFVREPNDGGDGWFPIYDQETGWDYSPVYNDDYGDLHLKSTDGRFVWDGFARADFNLDKRVDLIDFSELAQVWRDLNGSWYYWHPCNLNGDGTVDLDDFALFCDDYLQPRVFGAWVADDVTSPCIDAGDPNDAGWQDELWPHGGRINMGAYGGTPQASMSPNSVGNPADLNHDDFVDIADWGLWADDWIADQVLLDSDLDRDNDVDPNDMSLFLDNWLWTE